MKVEKKKFDTILEKLLAAKPQRRKKIDRKMKHRFRPIRLK